MTVTQKWIVGLVCSVLALASLVPVLAQQPEPDGSVAALTAEVRLLRLAIERTSQTQSQLQALTIYLSAQQSRLVQTSARADALAKDADAAALQSVRAEEELARWKKMATDRSLPADLQRELPSLIEAAEEQQARSRNEETRIRTRAIDANATLQVELSRWNDLIGRLEQISRP